MASRMYIDRQTEKLVHAKPSTQSGIIIWYFDKDGQPSGRCHAATVAEFNDRFRLAPRTLVKQANEARRAPTTQRRPRDPKPSEHAQRRAA